MSWQTVIGLELHIQLHTRSKLFCGSPNAFGGAPNSRAGEVDSALPGTLPVINREAVGMAVQLGLALGAEINRTSVFVRKNYFYPDLPKNYQISQLQEPVFGAGTVEVPMPDGGTLSVRINHAHLEEDAGRLVHDVFAERSAVDLNRAGVPLIEVVSEPDMHSPEEAVAYARALHRIVRYLGICSGNLSRGELRCDANVSVRPDPEAPLGTRTELKNINSFRFIGRAIEIEAARQLRILKSGGEVAPQTLLFDPDRDIVQPMREKDTESDYRYFPDPDLLPVYVDDDWLEELRSGMPAPQDEVIRRYEEEFGLTDQVARQVAADVHSMDYFDRVRTLCGDAALAGNWMAGALTGALHRDGLELERCPMPAETLGELLRTLVQGGISSSAAKKIFESLWSEPGSVDERIDRLGLRALTDSDALKDAVEAVIAGNPGQVEQYRAGRTKVLGYLIGQVMQATGGTADAKTVNRLMRERLDQPGGDPQS
ncbi:MAG: Asp-tRNA(Asn)/Glu-tRNA(Gln) amidotransferase subunit GatB [Gammaproteobacteria bacterium AqS3]|nr:Asp-tRNA(Asn)/Glu-tRNA(Gln) amidotransferase subunit GatB [Gammaproteobacteria bacterium AqS3]